MPPTLGQSLPPGCPIGQVRARSLRTSQLYGELGYGGHLFGLAVKSPTGAWLPISSPSIPGNGTIDWGTFQAVAVGMGAGETIAVHQSGQYPLETDDGWMPRNPTIVEMGNVTSNPWTVETWAASAHDPASPAFLRWRSTYTEREDALDWTLSVSRTTARPEILFDRWNLPWMTVDSRSVLSIRIGTQTFLTSQLPDGSGALSFPTTEREAILALSNGRRLRVWWHDARIVKLWRLAEEVVPFTAILPDRPSIAGKPPVTLRFGLQLIP